MQLSWNNIFSHRVNRMNGSQIRSFFGLTENPEFISFAGGFPDSSFFPRDILSKALSQIAREEAEVSLQYSSTEGNYDLRCYLASKMANFNRPRGGFFIWVSFPSYYPSSFDLLSLAMERKVVFVHGEGFFSGGKGAQAERTARFSYSQNSLEEIAQGIQALGEMFFELEQQKVNKSPAGR